MKNVHDSEDKDAQLRRWNPPVGRESISVSASSARDDEDPNRIPGEDPEDDGYDDDGPDETTTVGDYSDMTKKEMLAEVERRNEGREDDAVLEIPKKPRVDDLVKLLEDDDLASAGDDAEESGDTED